VVAKVAGMAARDIPGVFSMGDAMSRETGQIKSLIPGSGLAADQAYRSRSAIARRRST
jgi:uncharacterized alkaline shock family protein YloU